MEFTSEYKRFHPVKPEIVRADLPSIETVLHQLPSGIKRAKNHSNYKELEPRVIEATVRQCLEEAYTIEVAARNPERWQTTEEDASRPHLTILLSAAGGTYKEPTKPNFYGNLPWSHYSDRMQSDEAAKYAIATAGIATGQDFSTFLKRPQLIWTDPKLNELRKSVREALVETRHRIVYIGTPLEGQALREVIESENSFIPNECVTIIDPDTVKDTVTQLNPLADYLRKNMQTEQNPNGFITPDIVPTVAMTIQANRFFRLKQVKELFKGIDVRLFPVASSEPALKPFTILETNGTIANAAIGVGDTEAMPYTLIGNTSN